MEVAVILIQYGVRIERYIVSAQDILEKQLVSRDGVFYRFDREVPEENAYEFVYCGEPLVL